jgi:hypothetical protein
VESSHLKSAVRESRQSTAVARLPFGCLLAIALALGGLSCGTCNPRPFISSIAPNTATAGGNQFLLTVKGGNFRRDSLVSWNGSLRVTSFLSNHQLEAAITTADIATPGSVLVLVFNPPSGNTTSVSGAIGNTFVMGCIGKDSNAVAFTISP